MAQGTADGGFPSSSEESAGVCSWSVGDDGGESAGIAIVFTGLEAPGDSDGCAGVSIDRLLMAVDSPDSGESASGRSMSVKL